MLHLATSSTLALAPSPPPANNVPSWRPTYNKYEEAVVMHGGGVGGGVEEREG